MTEALNKAFQEAAKLPEDEQDELASAVVAKVREIQQKRSQAFTRLSEERFASDWANEKDAAYDNWKEIYNVS